MGAAAAELFAPQPEPAAFERLRACLHAECGVWLDASKANFIRWRLASRLRELGLDSFLTYARRVEADAEERRYLVEALLVHETRFFREPEQLTWLEREVYPRWRQGGPRKLRAWSAGCATGQEPFSLAMSLLAHFPPEEGWSVEVLGTDVSTRALAQAEAAVWPRQKAQEIPTRYLQRFMLRGTGPAEGLIRAGPRLRSVVRLQPLNLLHLEGAAVGTFDVVLCRNVLIYFDARTGARLVQGLVRRLAPDGLLLLGHAEGLYGMVPGLRGVFPAVYTRAPAGSPP